MTSARSRDNDLRWRIIAGAGAVLVLGAAVLELVQISSPYGFPFIGWIVATTAGLAMLWVGLNAIRQDLGARVVAAALAVGILGMILIPYIVVVVFGAFQRRIDLMTGPHLLPPALTAVALEQLLKIEYFETGLRNSLIVSSTAAIVTTMLGLLGAYAIAQLRFPGRRAA